MTKFSDQKKITLEASYDGTGLLAENGETIQYEDLNLTEEIIQETKSWLSWYWDSFYDPEDFPTENFNQKGFEIAKKLKSHLGNSYRVYCDHREIVCNEEGEFEIENKNQIELIIDKFNALKKKLDVELSPEGKGEMLIGHRELVLKAEEIAQEAHRHQPYGTHRNEGDYYSYHLDVVRKTANIISKESGAEIFKIEIVALLHDLFEDTSYPEDEINSLFGDDITNSIKLLSFDKTISEEEYLERISNDELAKVVKAADRVSNVTKLLEVEDIEKRKKLFKKYLGQYPLFKNYTIFPEKIEEAFTSLVI